MNIDLIFKLAAVGVLVAVISTVLAKAGKEEIGHLVTLAAVSIVFMVVVGLLTQLFASVKTLFNL
ncbi:MAG: stage III sporulation protein AC [Thermaerobacter sp.]|nr:stage III sporulation protein AC [Thermaerobacter sp.]